MKTYLLINNEGCQMDSVITTSFKKARKFFNSAFYGKYTICYGDEGQYKRVNLK